MFRTDISNQMRTKSKQECERHYQNYYLNNSEPPLPGNYFMQCTKYFE